MHYEETGLQVQPPLSHAHSELNTCSKRLEGNNGKEVKKVPQLSACDNKKEQAEWLQNYKFISKENYYKIFGKYCQVKEYKLINIYDPPMTIKEIKKLRREKRRLYRLKISQKKNVGFRGSFTLFLGKQNSCKIEYQRQREKRP